MQKAVISWIGVRKFITTDKRKLFYEPSSAKMNSRNFLFFIKEPVFLKLVQKRINVGPNSFIFTMKVCATSHNTLQNTVFRISDSHPVYAVYQGDKVHPATICLISFLCQWIVSITHSYTLLNYANRWICILFKLPPLPVKSIKHT